MLGVDFGDDVEYKEIVGANRGEISIVSRFAIHIHSSWRLLKNGSICLGQSDFFNRIVGEFKRYEDDKSMQNFTFPRVSKKLNKLFKNKVIKVIKIEANKFGDLKIYMENDYCLEVFVDATGCNESWRFFRSDDDSEHFIVFDQCEI
jgi:hypothetical protein